MSSNRFSISKEVTINLEDGHDGESPRTRHQQARLTAVFTKAGAEMPAIDLERLKTWKESMRDPKLRKQLVLLLQKTLIFAQTSEAFRNAVVDVLEPVEFGPGQVVFKHGQPGLWAGILLSGMLTKKLQKGKQEMNIGDVWPGGVIGDLGLFSITPTRSFSVTSETTSLVLVLAAAPFQTVIDTVNCPKSASMFQDGQKMRNLMADTDSFVKLACFKNLHTDFVMALREHSEPRLCYPGQVIMKESHFGDEMYVLRGGSVSIHKGGAHIVDLPAGVVLGELAVLGTDKRRTATVTAKSLCLVRAIHGDVFQELMDQFPKARLVFDHAYVAKLVKVDCQNTQDEVKNLNRLRGAAAPKSSTEMQALFGETVKIEPSKKTRGTGLKNTLALPPLTPRGRTQLVKLPSICA